MSKSLEDLIREAAAKGWLSRTSIVKVEHGWQVNTPSRFASNAWAVEINADPVVALRAALEPYAFSSPVAPAARTAAEMEE